MKHALRYTDCLTLRNGELQLDAGLLREFLAHGLAAWRAGGLDNARAAAWWRHERDLARLTGRPLEQVHADLMADAMAIEDEEGL
jgi:protein-disulfide isomerase-like protein with CxxC motif